MDSILNDIGMVMVCGALKNMSPVATAKHVRYRITPFITGHAPVVPAPVVPFFKFDSHAYDEDESSSVAITAGNRSTDASSPSVAGT